MPPLGLWGKGTSYSFPLLSLQGQKGKKEKKKKKKRKETKQIKRAICNPEHTAACQMPLTAATKKAFLSFVNISFLLRFCINWCFSSREYSGRGVGGRGVCFCSVCFLRLFRLRFWKRFTRVEAV